MLWATLREVSSCRNDCHIDLSKQPPAGTGNLRVSLSPSPIPLRIFALAILLSNAFFLMFLSLINSHWERETMYASFTVTLMAFRQETTSNSLPFFQLKAAPNFPILRHVAYLCVCCNLLCAFSFTLSYSLPIIWYPCSFSCYWLFQLVFKAVNLALFCRFVLLSCCVSI